MEEAPDRYSVIDARKMLALFAGFGVRTLDVSFTDINGEVARFVRNAPIRELNRRIGAILASAEEQQLNMIVRPPPGPPVFLQLDDLISESVSVITPIAFMVIETSPGSNQAWLAFEEPVDLEFARSLRRGVQADLHASGAVRIAGSVNFKQKYAPAFPSVRITHGSPGLVTTPSEIQELRLLAEASESQFTTEHFHRNVEVVRRGWPSYQQCVECAPTNRDGTGPDISRADFTWCLLAIDWGWPVEATANRLMEESRKAKVSGVRYARRTAARAAEAVQRRKLTLGQIQPN
jgi:hypothetical protein